MRIVIIANREFSELVHYLYTKFTKNDLIYYCKGRLVKVYYVNKNGDLVYDTGGRLREDILVSGKSKKPQKCRKSFIREKEGINFVLDRQN